MSKTKTNDKRQKREWREQAGLLAQRFSLRVEQERTRWLQYWIAQVVPHHRIQECGGDPAKFKAITEEMGIETKICTSRLGEEVFWCGGKPVAVLRLICGSATYSSFCALDDRPPQKCPNPLCAADARVKADGTLLCLHCGAVRQPTRPMTKKELAAYVQELEQPKRSSVLDVSNELAPKNGEQVEG